MTSSESHVVAVWNWKTIFISYPTFILLFNLGTQSLTLNSPSSTSRYALLMITSALPFTTRTLTPTPIFIISPHLPVVAKKGLSRSQLFRLRGLCSEDSDFLEKGGEMVSFSEQRGYSPALLQNDLQVIRRFNRTDVLNNHNPSNQRSERIPLVLTYHPLNKRIKRILVRNFNILSSDPEHQSSLSAATAGRLSP